MLSTRERLRHIGHCTTTKRHVQEVVDVELGDLVGEVVNVFHAHHLVIVEKLSDILPPDKIDKLIVS